MKPSQISQPTIQDHSSCPKGQAQFARVFTLQALLVHLVMTTWHDYNIRVVWRPSAQAGIAQMVGSTYMLLCMMAGRAILRSEQVTNVSNRNGIVDSCWFYVKSVRHILRKPVHPQEISAADQLKQSLPI